MIKIMLMHKDKDTQFYTFLHYLKLNICWLIRVAMVDGQWVAYLEDGNGEWAMYGISRGWQWWVGNGCHI